MIERHASPIRTFFTKYDESSVFLQMQKILEIALPTGQCLLSIYKNLKTTF
jgi:hypothetical protein